MRRGILGAEVREGERADEGEGDMIGTGEGRGPKEVDRVYPFHTLTYYLAAFSVPPLALIKLKEERYSRRKLPCAL